MARKTGSHSEITGPRIQEVALDLISRHGFAAVSMRQIASEVGLQVGALYNYTPDKQSLLVDLLIAHMEEALAARRIEARRVAGRPARNRLEAFVRFHISWHRTRGREVFISYMELRNLTDENFRKVERLRRAYEDELEAILTDGVAEGEFLVADTRITSMALIPMLNGVTNWYREGGRLDVPEIETLYWGLVARSVGLKP